MTTTATSGATIGQAVPEHVTALRAVEAEVSVLVRRVRRIIWERARAVHPSLQPASYLILAHIRDAGPLRASVLSTAFEIDKGAISRQVQHLIDLGLVDREPDPEDGRATLLSITPTAAGVLDDLSRERSALLAARRDDWAAADIAQLAGLLHRYNQALDRPDD